MRPCLASFLRALTTSAPLAPAGRGVGGEGWCTQSIKCLGRGRTSPPGEEKQRCSATRKRPPSPPSPSPRWGEGSRKLSEASAGSYIVQGFPAFATETSLRPLQTGVADIQ